MALDILIVDDEPDIRDLIADILQDEGYSTKTASDSITALNHVEESPPAAVILDIWLQGSQMDGLGILEKIKQSHPDLPVIMISGHGNIETAISSVKMGAYDYIEKPFKEDKLLLLVKRAIESAQLKSENARLKILNIFEDQLIGTSTAITNLKNSIARFSKSESRIMLSGTLGCNKEVIAKIIHDNSNRKGASFIASNMANIPTDRIDEVLFGKTENTQTNSSTTTSKAGLFEEARNGTIFIDEITHIPIDVQNKILNFIQSGRLKRQGSEKEININVRIISSYCKNIEDKITMKQFSEDLYHRLNVVNIKIPPLKERKSDIAILAEYFIRKCAKILGVAEIKINESAINAMTAYEWPGNMKQFKNVIEWLLIMYQGEESINASMLPPEILSNNPLALSEGINSDILSLPLRAAREVFEKQYIAAQLSRFGGNISKTASFIEMERSAFHRKLKALEI